MLARYDKKDCIINLLSHYIAASYSISTSFSYIFGDVAFVTDLLKNINDPDDNNVQIPSFTLVAVMATFLLYVNWRTYYNYAREWLITTFHKDENERLPEEHLFESTDDEINGPTQNKSHCEVSCENSAETIGAVFKSFSMAFSSYLLMKKMGCGLFYSIIPPAILLPGNSFSQLALFKEPNPNFSFTSTNGCRFFRNDFCFYTVAISYSFSSSASYVYNVVRFVEYFLNRAKDPGDTTVEIPAYAIALLFAVTLFAANLRTYYNLTKKYCGGRKNMFSPPGKIERTIGAVFKAVAMAFASVLLIQQKTDDLGLILTFPSLLFPGNLVSQLGLFGKKHQSEQYVMSDRDQPLLIQTP